MRRDEMACQADGVNGTVPGSNSKLINQSMSFLLKRARTAYVEKRACFLNLLAGFIVILRVPDVRGDP